jgi:hypothetical protein
MLAHTATQEQWHVNALIGACACTASLCTVSVCRCAMGGTGNVLPVLRGNKRLA